MLSIIKKMKDVFRAFAEAIENRSDKRKDINSINEKTIVATLFNVMSKEFSHNDITLEVPHSTLKEKQSYDMQLCISGNKKIAIECKYYKKTKSPPRPLKAGSLFKDLRRLSNICLAEKETICYCVFIVADQMADYFSNHHPDLFELQEGKAWKIPKEYVYDKDKAKTFSDEVGESFECKITNVLDRSFDENGSKMHIKIFKVET